MKLPLGPDAKKQQAALREQKLAALAGSGYWDPDIMREAFLNPEAGLEIVGYLKTVASNFDGYVIPGSLGSIFVMEVERQLGSAQKRKDPSAVIRYFAPKDLFQAITVMGGAAPVNWAIERATIQVVGPLIGAVDDADAAVRDEAAEALRNVGGEQALAALTARGLPFEKLPPGPGTGSSDESSGTA